MALQGTLDTFALPDVLRLLAATQKTGQLRLSGGRGSGAVWIDGGAITGLEAPHVAHVGDQVDVLFELLRFEEGSFTFDADASAEAPGPPTDVEELLAGAEALLAEWREIESVVPSMEAWVTLRRTLADPTVTIDASQWVTLAAVAGGTTVRGVADELGLGELPVSRAVRDLLELGIVDIAPQAPPGREAQPVGAVDAGSDAPKSLFVNDLALSTDEPEAPTDQPEPAAATGTPDLNEDGDAPLPTARPLRARRTKGAGRPDAPPEPDHFVPLDLPGNRPAASYDPEAPSEDEDTPDTVAADGGSVDDLAAAFPGLASRLADPTPDDEELARQLAMLSPRAAEAVRAAAEATTVEERDAALDAAAGEDEPVNRGMLLKFLSSVRS